MMDDFYERRQQTARKERSCGLCGKPIYKGLEYIHIKGKRKGHFYQEAYHIHCDALIDAYCQETECEEMSLDDVNRWVKDSCDGCQSFKCLEQYDTIHECDIVLECRLREKFGCAIRYDVREMQRLRTMRK